MNLDQIETKCFILALFIRDDGERFLLGSRAYEFVDSQLHFAANSYQNDIVEVQGNDGVMLAGQVRRGTSQAFDGYIGDQTVDRASIEQYRRDFMKFFRKNHYYKVVYVFPDGSAVQRRNGFIVEAPEVKELYQLFPKYHISMNFEDINYYLYEEDADGQEIYGESATLKIATAATGGLIWEELSQTTLTGEGTNFSLDGTVNGNPISNVQLKGDTTQQTYSGKNLLATQDRTATKNGVTITMSSNGEVSFSGTCSGSTEIYVAIPSLTLAAGTYTSSTNINIAKGGYMDLSTASYVWKFATSMYSLTASNTTTLAESTTFTHVVFRVVSGVDYTGLIVKPMLESGSSATSFEPYVGGIPAPNPDYPQTVNTVTGRQVVTISDSDSQSQEYEVNLGDIELCKIGTYQDYIYKSGDEWYVHKAINKVLFDGTEDWVAYNMTAVRSSFRHDLVDSVSYTNGNEPPYFLSDKFTVISVNASWYPGAISADTARPTSVIVCFDPSVTTTSAFKTWLTDNNVTLYYVLATPTDTKITDSSLIAQLEALAGATTYDGTTVFTVTSPNQLAILSLSTIGVGGGGVMWNDNGAVWEEGTGGGPTMIDVDSIDNVYPVWTVTGPAVNPQISVLTTNTTLSYSGTVTASQELKIDMFNKTATLNGASVVGNVSGDWVYLKPGVNRITYTTNNADAPDSTIWWQEIVG